MTKLARDIDGATMQVLAPGASQPVAIGAGSTQSTAFGTTTGVVRLVATVDCFVTIGANPNAVAGSSMYLPAGVPEFIAVSGGDKVAVVQSTSAGTLYVTEMR